MKDNIIRRADNLNLDAKSILADYICSQLTNNIVYEALNPYRCLICKVNNVLYVKDDGYWLPAIASYTFEWLRNLVNGHYRMLKNYNDKPDKIDIQ